jgi:hypothetical protein
VGPSHRKLRTDRATFRQLVTDGLTISHRIA